MRLMIVMSLLLMLVTPTMAQDDALMTEDFLTDFEAFIESEMAFFGIPGAAVAIVEDGELVYAEGFGVRNTASGDPVTPETLFRAGSITKSMTAMLMAQLVDEGALEWDTPVRDIWPDFETPQLTETVRIRDLMGMDTGLVSDSLNGPYWGDWTVDDLLASLTTMAVGGAFGEFFSYNNEVYATAGYVAARASGADPTLASYVDMMETRIFAPLTMDSTIITDDAADLGDNYAVSYGITLADGLEAPREVPMAPIGVIAPAGAVWTNVYDMADYAITQMSDGVAPDGSQVVSTANLHETWLGQVDAGDAGTLGLPVADARYGMGWITQTYQGVPMRYHDGGWEGQRAHLTFYPDDDIAIVILTNHQMGELFNLSLVSTFAERLYELEPLAVEILHSVYEDIGAQIGMAGLQLGAPEVDEADVAAYLGEYEAGWTVELREDGLLWMVRPGWEFLLYPMAPGLFLTASYDFIGAEVNFNGPDDAGRIWVTLDAETAQVEFDKLP